MHRNLYRKSRSFLLSVSLLTYLIVFPLKIAVAETVTLTSVVTVLKSGLDVEIKVKIKNSGDSIATGVLPKAEIAGEIFSFDPQDISEGAEVTFTSKQKLEKLAQMKLGAYPVRLLINYTDISATSHEIPAFGILNTSNDEFKIPFQATLPEVMLQGTARELRIPIISHHQEPARVTVSLFTGSDVKIDPQQQSFYLSPNKTKEILFTLQAQHRIEGKVAPLLLFIEYENEEFHGVNYVLSTVSMHKVAQSEKISQEERKGFNKLVLALGGALLLLATAVTAIIIDRRVRGRGL